MEMLYNFVNNPTVRYSVLFVISIAVLFLVIYGLFYVKETNYVHPALYVKRNAYGLGVYCKSDIPENTVIVRKTVFHTDVDMEYTEYCIHLIKKVLNSSYKNEFLTFVPDSLDETTNVYDYDDIREYHLKYLPNLDESTMMLYYYKMTRNVFKYKEQAAIVFGYGTRFNHACEINATYEIDETSKQKDVMVFTTTRNISAGEEIFIPYIDVNEYETVEDRLEHLKYNYGFDCGCPLCKGV
jgi:SET domain